MKQEFKQAPYGEPSFVFLREAGYAYVDKTPFIQVLEHCGSRFPFIVRPRRFGKSLFADMLMAYYDKAGAGEFEQRFAGTWIGEHPTPFAGTFFVLKLDFSGIEGGDGLVDNFIIKVLLGLQDFANRYLPEDSQVQELLDASWSSPAALLASFFRLAKRKLRDGIYLIIDEYDQFAQEILSKDPERFRAMTGAEGFLKAFYACIKDVATSGYVKRTFITGVTSISLDSMTSGFNLATNITHDAEFAGMMGFTDEELRRLIPQIVNLEQYGHSVDEVFDRMKDLYDGYRFSKDSDVTVFNSSMCLYYLRALAKTNAEPEDLLDPSFNMDMSKIDGILSLGNRSEVESIVVDVLCDIPIESSGGLTTLNLNAASGFSKRNVLSALVFMGFLTFSAVGSQRIVCPNRAVKDLFYRYWFWHFDNIEDFAFPIESQQKAIDELAAGNVRPILEFVSDTLSSSVGVHVHAHVDETAIQFALAMALNTSTCYKVTLEEEALGVGFTDLILKPNIQNSSTPGWVIELKYVKKSETTEHVISSKIAEAEEQLIRYSSAENVKSIPNLRRAAAVFSGTELASVKVF